MAGTFGNINSPITGYGAVNTGLPSFISNVVRVIFIAAGLFAFFNLIFAGFSYISAAGDKSKIEAALRSINMSLLGLAIMVAASVITGIISFILFGSPTAILAPNIMGPGSI